MQSIFGNYNKEHAKSFIRLMRKYSNNDLNQIITNRYSSSQASLEDINTLNQINKIYSNEKLIDINNKFDFISKRRFGGSVQQETKDIKQAGSDIKQATTDTSVARKEEGQIKVDSSQVQVDKKQEATDASKIRKAEEQTQVDASQVKTDTKQEGKDTTQIQISADQAAKDIKQAKKDITQVSSDSSSVSETSPELPQQITIIGNPTTSPVTKTLSVPEPSSPHYHDEYKDGTFIQQTFPVKGKHSSHSRSSHGHMHSSSKTTEKKGEVKGAFTTACTNSTLPFYRPNYNVET